MIIQCDQCNTKFNLDDTKVPDKGIKVRCAKCKHVFMVQREVASEEPDLDFLLSSLGAQAPEAGKEAMPDKSAPLATQSDEWQIPAQGFDATSEEAEEPAAKSVEERAPGGELGEDFFAAKEEPPVPEKGGYDYGEFSFEDDTKAPSEESFLPASSGETSEFEFGEFPFEAESSLQSDAQAPAQDLPQEPTEFDFGSKDIAGEEVLPRGEVGGIAAEEFEEKGFSFGEEESAPLVEGPTVEAKTDSTTESVDAFDFGEIALQPSEEKGTEISALSLSIPEEVEKEAAKEPTDFAAVDFAETKIVEPATSKEEVGKPEFDFSAEPDTGPATKPSFVPPMPSAEEDELPPLAISTRKKGRSIFSIAMTAIVVLIVLAIAGAGFYVFKAGPTAFNKLGLSFLAKWVGIEVEEGGIIIKNPQGSFMVNREVGEIFVVSGEAVNNFKKPRASIQVRATILGPKGEIVAQKSAYCGNYISKEQLTALPMAKIEEAMGSPFGDSLANLGVPPGKEIPFVIVFSGVPKNAAEFSTEVVGSTVAGQ